MCGISLYINKAREQDPDLEQVLTAMNEKILHRGPDAGGCWTEHNLAIGHRRLSIIDLSPAGTQPMQRHGLTISFNGEIYNYIELREELQQLGHVFQTATDTEVILAAYKQWGTGAFKRFNGMWAFILHDPAHKKLLLCRDHFGIKPLYYLDNEKVFAAASEIKQFTVIPGFNPELNLNRSLDFLLEGLLNHTQETLFEGVKELRPAHYLEYNLETHHWQIHPWFELSKETPAIPHEQQQAIQRFRELFRHSLHIRMRADVPVGSCLSGGLDSSSMVMVLHADQMAGADFATITSCYEDERYDERKFSQEVSKATGFKAHEVFPRLQDLLDLGLLEKMVYHQDQPFGSASHFSEYKVFEKARQEGKIVMLDGQGSDEFLYGYREFYVSYLKKQFRQLRWGAFFREMKHKASHLRRSLWQEFFYFLRSAYFYPLLGSLKKLGNQQAPEWLSPAWQQLAQRRKNPVPEVNSPRSLSIQELEQTSLPYQLHSEDRNSMMFSIESRLPFLDPELVTYGLNLPDSWKQRNGYTKWILREALPELPAPIRWRKDKMGFVAPDPQWMKDNSTAVRKELETLVRETPLFSAQLLEQFDRFIQGSRDYEPVYFRALTLGMFLRVFQVQIPAIVNNGK